MDIFDKYPELKEQFDTLCKVRRDEILNKLLETNDIYKELSAKRADTSIALKNNIIEPDSGFIFEEYSDAVYAQEIYELDYMYKTGFYDAINLLKSLDLLR